MAMNASIKWTDGRQFLAESGSGHSVVMDGNPDNGGRNTGPRPMEMLLMGDLFSAKDALRFGLINKVVKPEELDAAVMEYAVSIASRSTLTMSMGKPAFYAQLDMELAEAYAYTTEVMAKNMQEYDAQEGIDAFLEKRDPEWRGR